jgi:hypothetical protein
MENPATHNAATKAIEKSVYDWYHNQEHSAIGLSLSAYISSVLEQQGFLTEAALKV